MKRLLLTLVLAGLVTPSSGFTVEISTTASSPEISESIFKQAADVMGKNDWIATHSPDRTSDIYLALTCDQVGNQWVVVTRSMHPVSARAIGADDLVYLRESLLGEQLLSPAISRLIEEAAQTPTNSSAPRYFTDPTVSIFSASDRTHAVEVALVDWIHEQGDRLPLPRIEAEASGVKTYHAYAWAINLPIEWSLLAKQYPWKAMWQTPDNLWLAIGESPSTYGNSASSVAVKQFAMDTYQTMSQHMSLTPYKELPPVKGHPEWLLAETSKLTSTGIRTYFMAFNHHGTLLVRLFLWSSQPRPDLDKTVLPAILTSFSWKDAPAKAETTPGKGHDPALDAILPDLPGSHAKEKAKKTP